MIAMRTRLTRWTAGALTALLCATPVSAAAAQSQADPPPQTTTQSERPRAIDTPPQTPPQPNLDRIKKGLRQEKKLTLDEGQLRFYVQVLAKLPRIEDLIGDYDLMNGPVRGGGAAFTHNEYLGMTTPQEMYSTAGIKPAEMLQFALVNWLGQAFVKRIVQDLQNARSEREIREIREQIARELAALKGRKGGG
jgi:hypothetical protein